MEMNSWVENCRHLTAPAKSVICFHFPCPWMAMLTTIVLWAHLWCACFDNFKILIINMTNVAYLCLWWCWCFALPYCRAGEQINGWMPNRVQISLHIGPWWRKSCYLEWLAFVLFILFMERKLYCSVLYWVTNIYCLPWKTSVVVLQNFVVHTMSISRTARFH